MSEMRKKSQTISGRNSIHKPEERDNSSQVKNDDIEDEINDTDDPDESPRSRQNGEESSNTTYNRGSGNQIHTNDYSILRRQLEEVEKNVDNYDNYKPKQSPKVKKSAKNNVKTSKTGFDCFNCLIAIFAVIALVISFSAFDGKRFFQNRQTKGSVDTNTEWQTFQTEFESFERIYSEVIPIKGFKILKTSLRKVMNRNKWSQRLQSSSPAIVLLIASEENQNILKCVERDFINSINKAYNENNPIVINGKQTDATDIVDKFDLNFRDQQKHTIVLEYMESISPKDVMSLHQFTDHENAKYKDVVIVMTAINYQTFNLTKSANSREMDEIASKLFEIKWKNDLPTEQSFALISRLTPSVVTIIGRTENQFNC